MDRVEQLQTIKVDHCTLLSVLRSVTLHFRCPTKFHNLRMRMAKLCAKLHKSVRSTSMERVEKFQCIKVDHFTLFRFAKQCNIPF